MSMRGKMINSIITCVLIGMAGMECIFTLTKWTQNPWWTNGVTIIAICALTLLAFTVYFTMRESVLLYTIWMHEELNDIHRNESE